MDTGLLPKQINRKIGRAMHDYGMLSDGDKVLVAVSGGIDSMVMAWVLKQWQSKAPIVYEIEAVYINNGHWSPESGDESPVRQIAEQMRRFSIPFCHVLGWEVEEEEKRNCFHCSRNRRTQLFELARERDVQKIALGHHKDDLVETFFLNALYSGNISTMLPKQVLFEGTLSLIRILSYLEKSDVLKIAALAGIVPVKNYCPMAGDTRREIIRELLGPIYKRIPGAKNSVFSALSNVREDYMLKKRKQILPGTG